MVNTLTQILAGVNDPASRLNLGNFLKVVADSFSSQSQRSAGIVIKAGGSTLSKLGATAWYGFAAGKLVTIAASTDNAAYAGTVLTTKFNVYCHFIDKASTLTTVMGVAGASLATVVFPQRPEGKCLYGFTIINPTGTGSFVGGTSALDDGTILPNAVYVSVIGTPDPSMLIS